MTLTLKDKAALNTESCVNLGVTFSLGVQNLASFHALTCGLELHATFDLFGRLDILDFIPEALDAPLESRFIQRGLNLGVQVLTLFKCSI